jgi:hypothetical protein
MAIWLLQGLGNAQRLVFSIVTSLSTMCRSSPLRADLEGVMGDFKAL